MKALKWISFVLAGIYTAFFLSWNMTGSGWNVAMYIRVFLDVAVLALLLVSVFFRKRILGYIAIGVEIALILPGIVRSLQESSYAHFLHVLLLILLPNLVLLAIWVLWFFAFRNKVVSIILTALLGWKIIDEILSVVMFLMEPYIVSNPEILWSLASGNVQRVFYYLSLALAALWLALQKRKASPVPEAQPAAGVEE